MDGRRRALARAADRAGQGDLRRAFARFHSRSLHAALSRAAGPAVFRLAPRLSARAPGFHRRFHRRAGVGRGDQHGRDAGSRAQSPGRARRYRRRRAPSPPASPSPATSTIWFARTRCCWFWKPWPCGSPARAGLEERRSCRDCSSRSVSSPSKPPPSWASALGWACWWRISPRARLRADGGGDARCGHRPCW
jgi:hypothetical protein